jgi:hypothetical protein
MSDGLVEMLHGTIDSWRRIWPTGISLALTALFLTGFRRLDWRRRKIIDYLFSTALVAD